MPFLLVGISGVIPMAISLKQSGFYILPSFPYFAIGLGILMYPMLEDLIAQIKMQSLVFKSFKGISLLVFGLGLFLSLVNAKSLSRDSEKLKDIHCILNYMEAGSSLKIPESLWSDWSLHGYFIRYKNISLDTASNSSARYLLTDQLQSERESLKNLEPMLLPTLKYHLYEICYRK